MEYLLPPLGTLTTSMAAMSAGVQPATIRDWVRRGLLARCGGTPKRPIYRLADVEAARYAAKPNRPGQRGTTAA
ncbi:MerR family transcriptional regulator [Streptomyces antarcticus]|uniref:MerR family transcriptional regulator n=1 Tax=Streptomyces antarcticus TaxID=2996458 RepID=UPI00227188B1|nr:MULTISPECIES: MerR family transcriptional regulator [unclassified Streptomyces]MCY0943551.1 hypothetical protein [Streptomyces sp. H34-AA3]MCZ4083540.1 hypothetical protein [Streptomyces sp. H34-S5]